MGKTLELAGQRFGRLLVIKRGEKNSGGRYKWVCICDCGAMTQVTADKLKSGHTKSCGCLRLEVIKECNKTHGKSQNELYCVWRAIKTRSNNEKAWNYKNYGGRGISMCMEWKNSFSVFYKWAIENGYKKGLSIDRIDNDKGYTPENCRWTTPEIQAKNTRKNRKITFKGITMTESEWADLLGIKRPTLCRRIAQGWNIERALTTPVREKR